MARPAASKTRTRTRPVTAVVNWTAEAARAGFGNTLAWMLAKSPVVIPIPGSSRPETIRDSYSAVDLTLTADQVATLDAS